MSIKEIFMKGKSGKIVNLKIFENDTDVTFTERVASAFSTLPSFLYLSQPFSYISQSKSPILVHLINDDINDKNFTGFFENVKRYKYNIPDRDIALYWLSNHIAVLANEYQIISLGAEFAENKIEIPLGQQTDIDRIAEEIKVFVEQKEEAIAKNREKSKIFTQFWSEIQSNMPLPYFQFRMQKSTLFMKTNIKQQDISINTIFSNLVCNSEMVIFSLKKRSDNRGDSVDKNEYEDEEDDGDEEDKEEGEEGEDEEEKEEMYNEHSENSEHSEKTTIYKVYRKIPTYKAFPSLIDEIKNYETEHVIFGYMYDGTDEARNATFQQYSPLSLFFWEGFLYINININYEKSGSQTNQQYENLLCQRILNSIANMKVTRDETTYKNIIGVTFLPEISFKTILLSDMIMNDPIFSYFMAVKEFEHSSKKTAGLYTQFFLQGGQTGTCSITSKFVTEDDQEIKGLDMKDGTPFIRLRLKSSSQTNIEDFLRIFSKLIGLYRKKEPTIDKEYQGYGVSTDDKFSKVDLREKKTLWDFEPKIFLKGYARHSGKYPRIVEEKEASDIPDEKKMLFPRIPIEGTTKPQRWYSCDHHFPSHPYIGLKINNSENKDKVPVLPSCFIADQTNSINMKDYLSGKTILKKEHIQQIIITTDKFVQNDALGNLPKSLDELLLSLEKENVIKKHDYFRRGVPEKNHHISFLECVLKATDKEYRINDELNRLIEHPNLSVASQENPGDTVEEIKEKLLLVRDHNDYMDPRRWIRLCEEVYKFKIILFSRGADDIDPVLTFPYHDFVYLSNRTRRSIIFIYEHYGAERTKKDKFPRCELIVSCEKNDVVPVNCSDVSNLDNFFLYTRTHIEEYQQNQLYQYFYNQNQRHITRIQEFNLPERITENIIAQAVDSHGKTRAILLKNNIICLTPPLPPFFIRAFSEEELNEIYRPHAFSDIKKFLTQFDLPIHSISKKSTTKIDEIHISIEMNIFTIKTNVNVEDIEDIEDIKNVPTKYPSYSSKVQLQTYFFRKKLTFVMVEYFIYFFSYWCSQNKIQTEIRSVETMKAFMENVVESKNLYIPPTSPSISIDILLSNGFLRSSPTGYNFIVDHKETRKRLLYTLLLRFQTKGIEYIEEYHTKKEIDDFYSDISMYCLNEKDTIVIDQLSILTDIDRHVYSTLQPDFAKYFIQHNAISTDPVLLIAEKDRKDAKKVSYEWNKNGRIDGDGKGVSININDSIYVYNSHVDVRNVDDQKNEKNEPNAETLVYKKNGTHYMALARL